MFGYDRFWVMGEWYTGSAGRGLFFSCRPMSTFSVLDMSPTRIFLGLGCVFMSVGTPKMLFSIVSSGCC